MFPIRSRIFFPRFPFCLSWFSFKISPWRNRVFSSRFLLGLCYFSFYSILAFDLLNVRDYFPGFSFPFCFLLCFLVSLSSFHSHIEYLNVTYYIFLSFLVSSIPFLPFTFPSTVWSLTATFLTIIAHFFHITAHGGTSQMWLVFIMASQVSQSLHQMAQLPRRSVRRKRGNVRSTPISVSVPPCPSVPLASSIIFVPFFHVATRRSSGSQGTQER